MSKKSTKQDQQGSLHEAHVSTSVASIPFVALDSAVKLGGFLGFSESAL